MVKDFLEYIDELHNTYCKKNKIKIKILYYIYHLSQLQFRLMKNFALLNPENQEYS